MTKALVLSGYGINCEEETQFAFQEAGAKAYVVHINDLIKSPKQLLDYQILAFPGGFSFGDDTGSGKAFANIIRNNLMDELEGFITQDKLVIGICNGFQILTSLGLLEGALTHNTSAQFICRWVDLEVPADTKSPWLQGIERISLPIAHGEGKFYADTEVLKSLKNNKQIALSYFSGEISQHFDYAANPNGSLDNIAAISSKDGKILGLMPHPERALFFTQNPMWTYLQEDKPEGLDVGPGLKIFQNAVKYFN